MFFLTNSRANVIGGAVAFGLLLTPLAFGQETPVDEPIIPSRVSGGGIMRIASPLEKLHGFVGVSGGYDSGTLQPTLDANGTLHDYSGSEEQITAGLSFNNRFRGGDYGLTYVGSYQRGAASRGVNQTGTFFLNKRLTKKWALFSELRGTSLNYNNSYLAAQVQPVSDLGTTPGALLFDTRTTIGDGTVRAVYYATNRLSFSFGGGATITKYSYGQLVSYHGATAVGDVAYRLSRRQTLSASYAYMQVGYKGQFGDANAHQTTLGYSYRLGRRYQLMLQGGGFRIETKGIRFVALDPIIAGILGVNQTAEIAHTIAYAPMYNGTVVGNFRRTGFWISGGQISSLGGNGVFLASKQRFVSGSYTYSASTRLNWNVGASYYQFAAVSQTLAPQSNVNFFAGLNYSIRPNLSLTGNYYYRNTIVDLNQFARDSNRVSVGLTYSFARIPMIPR